ncbi:putative iron-sulfur cluster assembly accessory protein Isa1 [Tirmania nivea]|nr:putative iron-sulfur cluster assembly accessory protein Isa1 [Tirmania nivea]
MIVTRIIRSKTSLASVARLISSPAAYRSMSCASYTTASPVSISTDGGKRQHRYLQTATVHRPSNLLDVGAPLLRIADAPLSSSTGEDASYPAHPPRPPKPVPVLQSIPPKVPSTTPAPQRVKAEANPTPTAPRASKLRTPRKAAMVLTPSAVSQLRTLLDSPDPKLIRVGVKNRGCSGLAYNLEYVEKPGKFDEEVVQDGVRVLIDSKALFSIIGSEMDWVEDKLSARFVFKNPNIKEQCGCGESFMVSD